MTDTTETLEHVYGAEDAGAIRETYETWAPNYDRENIAGGFRLPHIGAAFTARFVPRNAGPILDAGCGTGLVGEALSVLGYARITGLDISPAMLEIADGLRCYERLYEHDLGKKIPEDKDSFAAVTCFGSLGPGHAPADCLDEFIRITQPGGHIIFNVRPETYESQGLKGKIDFLTLCGKVREIGRSPVFRPYLLSEPELGAKIIIFEVP